MPHGFTSYIVTIDYARVIKTKNLKWECLVNRLRKLDWRVIKKHEVLICARDNASKAVNVVNVSTKW